MWAWSLTRARLTIGFYGLIHSYPVVYFISLGLLTAASFILWLDREEHGRLLCLQICLFVTVLFISPIILGSNPASSAWNYGYYWGPVDYILQHYHISPSIVIYHNWPGTSIFQSSLMNILGFSDPSSISLLSPLFFHILLSFFLYLFFKVTLRNINIAWAAIWIFLLADWMNQFYLSPQGLGFMLLIFILIVLTKPIIEKRNSVLSENILLIILFISLTIIHVLTSFICLLGIMGILLIEKTHWYELPLLLFSLIIVWSIYFASNIAESNLPAIVERIFRIDLAIFHDLTAYSQGSSLSHIVVSDIRIYFSSSFIILGLIGIISILKHINKTDVTFIFLTIVAIFTAISGLYGGELIHRTFLFLLLPLSYFIIILIKQRCFVMFLLVFLLISIPINNISYLGNAKMHHIPCREKAIWRTYRESFGQSNLITYGEMIYKSKYTYSGDIRIISLVDSEWRNELLINIEMDQELPQNILIGRYEDNYCTFWLNKFALISDTEIKAVTSPFYDLVYSNAEEKLYSYNVK